MAALGELLDDLRAERGQVVVLDSGRSIAEVARSIDVHEMTLGKWVKKAKQARTAADTDKPLAVDEREELERLRAENATLRMERDFAKKVATWFAKDQP
ncbi:transposase [Actinomycetospora soli]|uniref:transposase n=1 Tax=Actinomycetospora soli TaxID=2893887 RepID=UPI001E4B3948|nr:transposase [Actinomycetospora soli]MCD2191767.1 transposase [Actinomycetospora soli]